MEKGSLKEQGSITCVGVGMTLGSHISPLARSHIEEADIVFVLASDGLVEQWIREMNQKVITLQSYYHEGSSLSDSYEQMVDVMLSEVERGYRVVGAFYGHPGVFACVPHMLIRQASEKGFYAKMEPGISAEDCLYADLHIDPGEFGCAHYETSQFMFFSCNIEPSAYLVLWQVGIAGDTTLTKFSTGIEHRKVLVDLLTQTYPNNHQVILYEAPTLPIHQPRKDLLPLLELATAEIYQHTTLVIPPCREMVRNSEVYDKLSALAKCHPKLQLV